jgi:hypothetical protein
MRGITLPDRLRRRSRREVVDLVGRDASRLLAAPVAPAAERQGPPGSLTPEARRQLDEARARGAIRFASRMHAGGKLTPAGAVPAVKTPEQPCPDFTAEQLAAYRHAAEQPAPRPEYHPARGTAPATAPMAVLPDNAMVPVPSAAPVLAATALDVPSLAVLRRVRDGLETKWRAESFVADKRELPCFDATTRTRGWLGLHMPRRPAGFQRWSTEPWFARERALADAAIVKAIAELDAIHARHAVALPATGGAR